MSTGYYLLDHPPRRSQGAPRTTWGFPPEPSGVVAVHDTEGVMDDQGEDWGAENTAAYIVTRTDPGSYHEIHDGDSEVVMAPDDWMTWNVAADSANGHNWGISGACRTGDWHPDNPWTRRTIRRMGASICRFWQRNGFDVAKANRWITREEANRRIPGLILHGTWQPKDRSDAWAKSPHRAALDQMLVDAIAQAAGLVDDKPTDPITPPLPPKEDYEMPRSTYQLDQPGHPAHGQTWAEDFDGLNKVTSPVLFGRQCQHNQGHPPTYAPPLPVDAGQLHALIAQHLGATYADAWGRDPNLDPPR